MRAGFYVLVLFFYNSVFLVPDRNVAIPGARLDEPYYLIESILPFAVIPIVEIKKRNDIRTGLARLLIPLINSLHRIHLGKEVKNSL